MDIQNISSEDLALYAGLGFLVFCVILQMLGQYRKSTIKDKITDPYSGTMNPVVSQVESFKKLGWIEFKLAKENMQKLIQVGLNYLKAQESKLVKKDLQWFEFYWIMSNERIEEICLYEQRLELIVSYKQKISINFETQAHTTKHEYYLSNDSNYRKLEDSYSKWETASNKMNYVKEEIREALNAIDSAQTIETVDFFTKNKGISFMSSMSNSSANGEIREIEPAVKDLLNYLKQLEQDESVKYQNIDVSDLGDLFLDFSFDFSFDIGSLFALSSLSSAESEIKELRSKLSPVETDIFSKVTKAK